jgi:hypothetical protein
MLTSKLHSPQGRAPGTYPFDSGDRHPAINLFAYCACLSRDAKRGDIFNQTAKSLVPAKIMQY